MIRSIAVVLLIVSIFYSDARANDEPYGGVKLLAGYSYQRSNAFDTINGVIFKKGGLRIEFESGISEGFAVEEKHKSKYIWFREQVINGHKFRFALAKYSPAIPWTPETGWRSKERTVLMVTVPGKFGPLDAANFYGEVVGESEIADMLLMVLTFDPDI